MQHRLFFSQMHHSNCDGMHQASGQFGSPLGAVVPAAAPELPLPLIIVIASLNGAT